MAIVKLLTASSFHSFDTHTEGWGRRDTLVQASPPQTVPMGPTRKPLSCDFNNIHKNTGKTKSQDRGGGFVPLGPPQGTPRYMTDRTLEEREGSPKLRNQEKRRGSPLDKTQSMLNGGLANLGL